MGMSLRDYLGRDLPSRTGRKGEITTEFEQVGITPSPGYGELFPAIGPAGPRCFPSAVALRRRLRRRLEILRRGYREQVANVLVMEDDLARAKRFRSVEGSLMGQFLQSTWGFVNVGHGPYPGKIPACHRWVEARTSGPIPPEFESDPGGSMARTWTGFAGPVSRAFRQNDAALIRHPLPAHGARSLPCMSH